MLLQMKLQFYIIINIEIMTEGLMVHSMVNVDRYHPYLEITWLIKMLAKNELLQL